jgi:aryl-phospho-beta-D-glucosidase BglC (GH1 family)
MPRYGFNHLWMFSTAYHAKPEPADLKALDFQARWGLDFVRVPVDYRFWTRDFDYTHPDERVWETLDAYLAACRERGLHLSFNLHRAPGYCINGNELERHNLWTDKVAQDAFVFLWESFARRWKGVPSLALSFDLLNEPAAPGQYGLTRENHAALMRRTVAAIRAIDPDREIVLDGLAGGNLAMPELASLGTIQSGRGYQPMPLSHYRAGWCKETQGLPEPVWPGCPWEGKSWDKESLREHYAPWRELQAAGVPVHIGEFGCYNKVPNDLALAWFADLLSLYKEWGWGYSLWNFRGDFGIVEHGRPGTRYEIFEGFKVDRALLDLYLENRAGT